METGSAVAWRLNRHGCCGLGRWAEMEDREWKWILGLLMWFKLHTGKLWNLWLRTCSWMLGIGSSVNLAGFHLRNKNLSHISRNNTDSCFVFASLGVSVSSNN